MMKKYLTSLLNSVTGCSAILVYDIGGTPIFRVGELTNDETNAIKQNIDTFNSSIERTEKLCKTNSSKTIMAFYNNHQLLVFSKGTIVFIVVASAEANAGNLLNMKTYLEPLVSELLSQNSINDVAAGMSTTLSSTSNSNSMSNLAAMNGQPQPQAPQTNNANSRK